MSSARKYKWDKASRTHLQNYNEAISIQLQFATPVADELCERCRSGCNIDNHTELIAQLYSWLLETIIDSADANVPQTGHQREQKFDIPGWNDYVRTAHRLARSALLEWRAAGSPAEGSIAQHMQITRQKFKYAFRSCKRMADRSKSVAMTTCLQQKDVANSGRRCNVISRHPLPFHYCLIMSWEN